MKTLTKTAALILMLIVSVSPAMVAQGFRDFRIHDRGMLHETVFNTGEIGRGWQTGEQGNRTSFPLMEWPSRSATIVQGLDYSGQHNILGGGMYMAANLASKPELANRMYAFCGGIGASEAEVTVNVWSYPLSLVEIENFPLLDDGSINPDYNPDEAEEIIIAKWATPIGVTVTRTSRAWSYPDYDDMIIYEYTLEYTGDTDGDESTIEQTEQLRDFMPLFIYGWAPSMYGYQRHYQEWLYEGGIYRGDQNGFWDADYLAFHYEFANWQRKPDRKTGAEQSKLFRQFAETGLNGGALTSPQAPGMAMLQYDTTHLAIVDPFDLSRNESEAVKIPVHGFW
ncbi:MAG: hypothetical protein R3C26_18785 [Calditrichia bacterium]